MAPSPPLLAELAQLRAADAQWAGSKAVRLAALSQQGFSVPEGLCISALAYEQFLAESELSGRIQILIGRKRFEDMRWEELWDLALRIRNMFVRTAIPEQLQRALHQPLAAIFGDEPVVVRSAALSGGSYSAAGGFGRTALVRSPPRLPASSSRMLARVVSAMFSRATSVRNAWWLVMSTLGKVIRRASRSSVMTRPERSSKK